MSSSYKAKKRRVLEVRKRTKKREKTIDGGNQGQIKRSMLYRSEGALGRGKREGSIDCSFTDDSTSTLHQLVTLKNVDQKPLALRQCLRANCTRAWPLFHGLDEQTTKGIPKDAGGRCNARRRPHVVVFVRTTATALALAPVLGTKVSVRGATAQKYARHKWKPKGQGRVGGRSEGDLNSSSSYGRKYEYKGVGVLHAKSSESDESCICRDFLSGKLSTVIATDSGKLGPGDPLWEIRHSIDLVIIYDIPVKPLIDRYVAMTSYAGRNVPPAVEPSDRPRVLTFATTASKSACQSAKLLWDHLRTLGGDGLRIVIPTCAQISSLKDQTACVTDHGSLQPAAAGPRPEACGGREASLVTQTGDAAAAAVGAMRSANEAALRGRLHVFYSKHNPQKLQEPGADLFVSKVAHRCVNSLTGHIRPGAEVQLFAKLTAKYCK